MNRNSLLLIGGGVLLAVIIGLTAFFLWPHDTFLTGNAWDYALVQTDLPKDWTISDQLITTAFDMQAKPATAEPVTQSVSLKDFDHYYAAQYAPPENSDYLNTTSEIVLYTSVEAAKAALQTENPGTEWERGNAETLGDESQLWHFINRPDDATQNIYRIDFRYLNAIGSVTLGGVWTTADEGFGLARKILDKMHANAQPAELKFVLGAGLPDLRHLLISQTQLADLDKYLGDRWRYDYRSVPIWTPNAALSQQAQTALNGLNRVSGYQVFMVKSLSESERPLALAEGLFQQVTGYVQAKGADQALDLMAGIPNGTEEKQPPIVGDRARVWTATATGTNGTDEVTTMLVEITFRRANYVASLRLQSRPISKSEVSQSKQFLLDTATTYAKLLDQNIMADGK